MNWQPIDTAPKDGTDRDENVCQSCEQEGKRLTCTAGNQCVAMSNPQYESWRRISAGAADSHAADASVSHENRTSADSVEIAVPGELASGEAQPKLCNYCGVVIDSGAACATDGEFNHCPNKQIGAHVSGVEESDKPGTEGRDG